MSPEDLARVVAASKEEKLDKEKVSKLGQVTVTLDSMLVAVH